MLVNDGAAVERSRTVGSIFPSGASKLCCALWAVAGLALAAAPAATAAGEPGAPPLIGILRLFNKLETGDRRVFDAAYVEDALRGAALRNLPGLRVVDRSDLTALAAAQGRDLSECEGSCAVETARNLGLDYVVTGDVTRFGTEFKVVLRLNRASDGAQLAGSQASGATLDELDRNLGPAAEELFAPLAPKRAPALRAGLLDGASTRQAPALLPVGLVLGAAADPRQRTLGGEVLLSAPIEPLELRLGLSLAPHPGLRAAALFPVVERWNLGLALGVRGLVVPGLTAGALYGGGAGAEASLRLWREASLLAGFWLEGYRNGGASQVAPLLTLGLGARL